MKDVEIRFAQEKDLTELVVLCEKHAHFERAEYSSDNKESMLKNSLFGIDPSFQCLVVEHASVIVGYCSFMKQFSTWTCSHYLYMDCLFLSEEARSHGIGESIMKRLTKEAQAMGCKFIQWQTPSFNLRGINFYNRIGGKSISKERYFLPV